MTGADVHAFYRDAVNVRRGYPAVANAATIAGKAVQAQVVGNDQHPVRRVALTRARQRTPLALFMSLQASW